MIRALLADNHQLSHPGVRTILSTTNDITLVDTVIYNNQLQKFCKKHQPDIVLLALNIIDQPFFSMIDSMHQYSSAKILILLHNSDEVCLRLLIELGVNGAFLKSDAPDKLSEAIRAIMEGHIWFSSELLPKLLQMQNDEQSNRLTKREVEILQLVAAEKTDKEIALALGITKRTVRYHLENSNIKLGTTTRVGAVAEAIKQRLI